MLRTLHLFAMNEVCLITHGRSNLPYQIEESLEHQTSQYAQHQFVALGLSFTKLGYNAVDRNIVLRC